MLNDLPHNQWYPAAAGTHFILRVGKVTEERNYQGEFGEQSGFREKEWEDRGR